MGATLPMPPRNNFCFDAATGLSVGAREQQEDAVLCDIPRGPNAGLVVLADGLGGHAAGAVASQIAVSTALSFLAAHRDSRGGFHGSIPGLLEAAARAANAAILHHAAEHPETTGMGATLVILALLPDQLFWLSVGDSPLYLFRQGISVQLNETHSLAAQLDLLVEAGEMPATVAACHPDRHCLTSALGQPSVTLIDCPTTPFPLAPGDVIVLASDGILSLPMEDLEAVLCGDPARNASELASQLLGNVARLALPDQDNLSVAVIRPVQYRAAISRPLVDAIGSGLAATSNTLRSGLRHGIGPALRARRAK